MKIYLAGKISGLPIEEARELFEHAEKELKECGHEVVNPLKLPHAENTTWEDAMALDISHLIQCDAIFMLSNWSDSLGARLERLLAMQLGKEVLYQI